jgi:hypothetical protein
MEDTATPEPAATDAPTPIDPPTPAEAPATMPAPDQAAPEPTTEATSTGLAAGAPLLLIILAPTIFRLHRSRGRRDGCSPARSKGPGGPAG